VLSPKEILEEIECCEEPVIKYDGLDEALIGWATPKDTSGDFPTKLVYSASRLIEVMIKDQGMNETEAREWLSFNIDGAYLGLHTPIIVYDILL
jgi:hypothetical protein